MNRAQSSEAFCLHIRAYRESSALVQLFTKEHGRISAVAKGIKSATKSRSGNAALLQPFNRLQVSWVGRNDLKSITHVELALDAFYLKEKSLLAGLYLNELLSLLLPEYFEYPDLYVSYLAALRHLDAGKNIESTLRMFERMLLTCLGYEISFYEVDERGHHCGVLEISRHYEYQINHGFSPTQKIEGSHVFTGADLVKIMEQDYSMGNTLMAAKKLMRIALGEVLGGKKINSRELFL